MNPLKKFMNKRLNKHQRQQVKLWVRKSPDWLARCKCKECGAEAVFSMSSSHEFYCSGYSIMPGYESLLTDAQTLRWLLVGRI